MFSETNNKGYHRPTISLSFPFERRRRFFILRERRHGGGFRPSICCSGGGRGAASHFFSSLFIGVSFCLHQIAPVRWGWRCSNKVASVTPASWRRGGEPIVSSTCRSLGAASLRSHMYGGCWLYVWTWCSWHKVGGPSAANLALVTGSQRLFVYDVGLDHGMMMEICCLFRRASWHQQ